MADVNPEDFGGVKIAKPPAEEKPAGKSAGKTVNPEDFGGVPVAAKGALGSTELIARQAGNIGRKAAAVTANTTTQMDRDVDYSGVAAPGLRAEYGFLDASAEKQKFLKSHFGDKNVTQDSFGRDVVLMNGQKVAFLPRGGKDSGKGAASNVAGFADAAADVLPVGGMVLGSLATAPVPGASIVGSGVGAAGGKALNKFIKSAIGPNSQSSGEIAKDIALEIPKGMAGQGAAEAVGLVGRSILRGPFREGSAFGPLTENGKKLFAKAQEEVSAARAIGLTPKVGTYSPNASFTQRVQNAGFRLWSDDTTPKNRLVIERESKKLTGGELGNTPDRTEAINQGLSSRAEQIQRTTVAVADAAKVDAENALKAAEDLITSKVGTASGHLAENVSKDIQAAKQAFSVKAAELYAPVDALAGKPVVPTAGLKETMRKLIAEGPKTKDGQAVFASDTIKKFAGDIEKLPDQITFQEMQVARSTLRDKSAIEALNAGLSERQAARLASAADKSFNDAQSLLLDVHKSKVLGPDGKAITVVTPKMVEGVEKARDALRRADKFYAAGMNRFNDLQLEAMVKDATQSGFVEPERVASRLAQPGLNDRLLRVQKSVTPQTFGEIGAAKWKQMLDTSKDPLTGNVNGRTLANQFKKMGPVLETLYGKTEAGKMISYAEHLGALNGQIDAGALNAGHLSNVVRDAVLKKEASDAVLKRGFVKAITTDGEQSLKAVQWLTEPTNRLPMRHAIEAFGPQSQEVANIKEYMARRIFSSMEVASSQGAEKYGTTELMGQPLLDELNRYDKTYLNEVFGKEWTDSAYKLAKNIEVGTRKNPTDSGGMIAASIGLHWLRHLGEVARYFTASEGLQYGPVITYLSKGVEGQGVDFLQKALGKGLQVGAAYGAEEIPKEAADKASGFITNQKNRKTPFGNMLQSTQQQVRP